VSDAAVRFLRDGVLLDLEVDAKGRVFRVGAVRGRESFDEGAGAWERLDRFARGARFVAGHNLIDHDLRILRQAAPRLALARLPSVDTLELSPLAFPEVPYHRLVKDYKLVSDSANDPVADCRLAARVLSDVWERFAELKSHAPETLALFRHALAERADGAGYRLFFDALGVAAAPLTEVAGALGQRLESTACGGKLHDLLQRLVEGDVSATPLAYVVAWLRVAGSGSVVPPWVRRKYPAVAAMLHALRDEACEDNACSYCRATHDPLVQLKRFFELDSFRTIDGQNLQEQIVRAGMRDEPLLAILPTGAGKSLCFQLPALVRHFRRGSLTVVVSPLQALMKDQVDAFKPGSAAALYGLLTPPERGQVLENVRLGYTSLLYVSPEQFRNRSFVRAIQQREIGCWVFDEAHCLSQWGHDFRPDYLYAGRFIREFAGEDAVPPIAAFTATAKQDVKDAILRYFHDTVQQELRLFEASVYRRNLRFAVEKAPTARKAPLVDDLLKERLDDGSAIVYCATRRRTEEMAGFLKERGHLAEAFHAGVDVPEKKRIFNAFLSSDIRVMCATTAFGMGIDKSDVRLVIHADIPGSLENYLQEAGRAGRDQADAGCVLVVAPDDLETQFKLAARSQLTHRDIVQILRGLRHARRDDQKEIVLTSGELLREHQVDSDFDARDRDADTKVKTAVSWLERAGFLLRQHNFTRIFQGRPLVHSLAEAREKMADLNLSDAVRGRWERILRALLNARSDEGLGVDELAEVAGVRPRTEQEGNGPTAGEHVLRTLHSMASQGLLEKGLQLTAYVTVGVRGSSERKFAAVCALDKAMIALLQESAPDVSRDEWQPLSLRHLNQRLLDLDHQSNPTLLRRLLFSLAHDGAGPLSGGRGSIRLRSVGRNRYRVALQREWQDLSATATKRRAVAKQALDVMLAVAGSAKGTRLVEFSTEDIAQRIREDLFLSGEIRDPLAAIDRGLLFLHEQEVVALQRGLAVFRQAMTIRLKPEKKGQRYTKQDYDPLAAHYQERVFQIHVMGKYAELADDPARTRFVAGYFQLAKKRFVSRFLPKAGEAVERATSERSHTSIVDDLRNPVQQAIVTSSPESNHLILAGPGSGKTRVVVHRCAYLLRVRRVPARAILVLCFNRAAAFAVRRRLRDLVGADARGVTIATYHGLAMRLLGESLAAADTSGTEVQKELDRLVPRAVELLRGEVEIGGLEPDELRERILEGYQHILVDEYQDIDEEQYELISAIAGRSEDDPDRKLSILAVGDDDQNIYAWRGANVEFIRRFERDYDGERTYLIESYRSTERIIDGSSTPRTDSSPTTGTE